jgi:hypothetical protein
MRMYYLYFQDCCLDCGKILVLWLSIYKDLYREQNQTEFTQNEEPSSKFHSSADTVCDGPVWFMALLLHCTQPYRIQALSNF